MNHKLKLNKMKEPKRYYCGNGEGMFEDDNNGHWVEYSEHKAIVEQSNNANLLLAPVFDSFPLFYCQHKDAQWSCKHYKVVDKGFYSIETKCRFLGIDNETCNSKPCNADSCRQFLNGC